MSIATRSCSIYIPNWRPAPLNQLLRGHWKAHKLKKNDRELVHFYALQYDIPKAKGRRRVSLQITYCGRQKEYDSDNAWKSVLDALVRCGQLIDDNPKHVVIGPVIQTRGKTTSTTITLEDC